MQKQFFFLSPVEVVRVTSQNLAEVAEWCGGSVQETESRRVQGRMDSYVLVPTPAEKQVSWAFPGMWITKRLVVTVRNELRATFAVFRRDYFEKNYFNTPQEATDKTWEREAAERSKPAPKKSKKGKDREVHLTVNVGQALLEAQKAVAELEAIAEKHGMDTPVDQMQGLTSLVEPIIDECVVPLGSMDLLPEVLADEHEMAGVETSDMPTFHHDHSKAETCDSRLCTVDRYLDGTHYFTDAIALARPDKVTVWTDLEGVPLEVGTTMKTGQIMSEEELSAMRVDVEGKSEAEVEKIVENSLGPVQVVKKATGSDEADERTVRRPIQTNPIMQSDEPAPTPQEVMRRQAAIMAERSTRSS